MSWSQTITLGEVPRTGVTLTLAPDEAQRRQIARELSLVALDSLQARVRIIPWLDGVQLDGEWSAALTQTCGVTLERLDQTLAGDFMIRAVPAGSPHAPDDEEIDISLDADDPPDVLEEDRLDVAAYVIEQLALHIDPFPRKPGVIFEVPPETVDLSPFSALRKLQPKTD